MLSAALALVAASSCKKNHPPDVPAVPTGPGFCFKDTTYTFATSATDPDGDSVAVRFDWGDSTPTDWSGWLSSGDPFVLAHAWSDTGTFEVRALAQDQKQRASDSSAALSVRVVLRRPPDPPAAPTGPETGGQDSSYVFAAVASHPDSINVAIRFAWGDGDTSDWGSFVASGESVKMSHVWSAPDTCMVTAQTKDTGNALSQWSDPHTIVVRPLRRPPNAPAVPTGPKKGGQDSSYAFTTVAFHPDSITVAVRFAWGPGDTSDWSPFVASGESVKMSHAWSVPDTYMVAAQAKDTGNALSYWSDPHTVVIRPRDTLRIWRFQVKEGVEDSSYSSPAIGPDGTIYVGSGDSSLYAVNPNGTLKWRFQTGGVVRSSPAIAADGTVYVGSYDNRLYAINSDGRLKCSYLTDGNVPSSPAIAADGAIVFGSSDKRIYALNPDSTLKWSYATSGEVYSSPAIASDGTVYCGSYDDYLYALTPDGTLKWRYATGRDIESSPAIASDGTVYFGSTDGILYALNPDSTLKWSVRTNGQVRSSPAIAADGTVYFGSSDNCLYALDPNGTRKWLYVTGDNVNSSPAVSSNGTLYFGSDDNNLYALSPDSILVWRYPTDYDIESSPTIGPDGTIYFVGCDGYLYALKGTGTLATSSWPKFRHDLKNSGRVGGGQ